MTNRTKAFKESGEPSESKTEQSASHRLDLSDFTREADQLEVRNTETKFPSRSSEIVQAAIKGSVSVIPVVGGLIAELGTCLISPLEKRKREWAEEVESALEVLKSRYQKLPDALVDDPEFVTALLKATGIALATHRKEKHTLLRAFLIGVGSRAIPDEEVQHALLRRLDDLSVGHLEVLEFINTDYEAIKEEDQMEKIFNRYRNVRNGALDRTTFRWILADLSARMVIHFGDIADMNEFTSQVENLETEASKIRPLQITALGRQLLTLLRSND